MTTDSRPNNALPEAPGEIVREVAVVTPAQPVEQDRETNDVRPKSILALMEYAYSEGGRKLNLARRDLDGLSVDKAQRENEIEAVRRLAVADPFLAVPPTLLAAVGEHELNSHVVRRILELVLVALASHKLFENKMGGLADPSAKPALTAHIVSAAANDITFEALGLQKASEFSESARERMRVNAVTTFSLFRVLRDRWTSEQFINDMKAFVWRAPRQRSATKLAATLANAKNPQALSQLSRHFEVLLRDSEKAAAEARSQTNYQKRLAEEAQALQKTLSADLHAAKAQTADLTVQIAELSRRLSQEQSSRVVDKSHLVDDYETLRTQVVRRLTAQVELLSDGLHALRHGSTGVAEEFVDRALGAIDAEVKRLRNVDGGTQ